MRTTYVVRTRTATTSSAAASTTAREWQERHGGSSVVVETRALGLLRRRIEAYGSRWSR